MRIKRASLNTPLRTPALTSPTLVFSTDFITAPTNYPCDKIPYRRVAQSCSLPNMILCS